MFDSSLTTKFYFYNLSGYIWSTNMRNFWILLFFFSVPIMAENVLTPGTTAESIRAVANGLVFLDKTQDSSGAWHADVGYKLNDSYRVTKGNTAHVGGTSLACLAFMASGNLPNRGRYGRNVRKRIAIYS